MTEKIEMQKSNYGWMLSSINNADAKAGFLITIILALIGFAITQLDKMLARGVGENSCEVWCALLTIAFFLCSLASLSFAIVAVWPRITKKSDSFLYFNSIQRRSKEEYAKSVMELDENSMLQDISGQVWNLSRIIEIKYKRIRLGMIFFGLTVLFLALIYSLGT